MSKAVSYLMGGLTVAAIAVGMAGVSNLIYGQPTTTMRVSVEPIEQIPIDALVNPVTLPEYPGQGFDSPQRLYAYMYDVVRRSVDCSNDLLTIDVLAIQATSCQKARVLLNEEYRLALRASQGWINQCLQDANSEYYCNDLNGLHNSMMNATQALEDSLEIVKRNLPDEEFIENDPFGPTEFFVSMES